MKRNWQISILGAALVAIAACATQKPVLAPNEHLNRVGSTTAAQDVDQCLAYGKAGSESGQAYGDSPVASAATNSVAGAAAGGAGGAIFGNAGAGAAAGAVGGAVGSITHWLLDGAFKSKAPEPATRQITEYCLRQRGYEPMGWR